MYVDIHQHLIYGLDDGAENKKMMFKMLKAAAGKGVGLIVATVHATPGENDLDLKLYYERLAEANAYCQEKGLDLKVYSGSEILYTTETVRFLKKKRIPTIANKRLVLLEFPISISYDDLVYAIRNVRNAGYQIVLAHAERYFCLRKLARVICLREQYDVIIQINARTVISRGSFFGRIWIRKMFRERLIDVVASDSHNISSRPNYLEDAYLEICDKYGKKMAKKLCVYNPYRLVTK